MVETAAHRFSLLLPSTLGPRGPEPSLLTLGMTHATVVEVHPFVSEDGCYLRSSRIPHPKADFEYTKNANPMNKPIMAWVS